MNQVRFIEWSMFGDIMLRWALVVCRTSQLSSRRSLTRSTTRRGTASWDATLARTWRMRRATSSTSTWAKWPSCCSRAARRGCTPSKFYVVSTDAVLPGDECLRPRAAGGARVSVCVWVCERVPGTGDCVCAARHATRTSLKPTVYYLTMLDCVESLHFLVPGALDVCLYCVSYI